MESGLMSWLTSLLSGAVGGNVAGALLKDKSLGTMWNSVAGVLGGGLGGQLLGAIGLAPGGGMIGNVASSAIGGAVVMAIVGFVKKMMGKKTA